VHVYAYELCIKVAKNFVAIRNVIFHSRRWLHLCNTVLALCQIPTDFISKTSHFQCRKQSNKNNNLKWYEKQKKVYITNS